MECGNDSHTVNVVLCIHGYGLSVVRARSRTKMQQQNNTNLSFYTRILIQKHTQLYNNTCITQEVCLIVTMHCISEAPSLLLKSLWKSSACCFSAVLNCAVDCPQQIKRKRNDTVVTFILESNQLTNKLATCCNRYLYTYAMIHDYVTGHIIKSFHTVGGQKHTINFYGCCYSNLQMQALFEM